MSAHTYTNIHGQKNAYGHRVGAGVIMVYNDKVQKEAITHTLYIYGQACPYNKSNSFGSSKYSWHILKRISLGSWFLN